MAARTLLIARATNTRRRSSNMSQLAKQKHANAANSSPSNHGNSKESWQKGSYEPSDFMRGLRESIEGHFEAAAALTAQGEGTLGSSDANPANGGDPSYPSAMGDWPPTPTAEAEQFPSNSGRSWIINPRSGWKIRWDIAVGLMILYSVVVLPLRIGFEQEAEDGAFYLDCLIDVCFGIDMLLSFRTGFYTDQELYIYEPWSIARRYLRGFFLPDLFSTVPFDLIVKEFHPATASDVRSVKLVRVVRLVRLMKLMRLFKLKRFVAVIEGRIELNPSIVRMVKLIFKIIALMHLLSCFWYFIATLGSCQEDDEDCVEEEESWILAFGVDRLSFPSRYIASFHWVTASMMAVGYGDLYARNLRERLYSIFTQLLGSTAFGFILSAVTTLLDSANPRDTEYKKRMGEVKEWLTGRDLPVGLQKRIRQHFTYYLSTKKSIFNESDILGNMPMQLRNQIVEHSYKRWIWTIAPLFDLEERSFIFELMPLLRPQQAEHYETILEAGEISLEVFFILMGSVAGSLDNSLHKDSRFPWSPYKTLTNGSLINQPPTPASSSGAPFRKAPESQTGSDGNEEPAADILCAVFAESEQFGEFVGNPMRHRACGSRCELLVIHKDALYTLFSRYPGANERYAARDSAQRQMLSEVFESADVWRENANRYVKSVMLVRNRTVLSEDVSTDALVACNCVQTAVRPSTSFSSTQPPVNNSEDPIFRSPSSTPGSTGSTGNEHISTSSNEPKDNVSGSGSSSPSSPKRGDSAQSMKSNKESRYMKLTRSLTRKDSMGPDGNGKMLHTRRIRKEPEVLSGSSDQSPNRSLKSMFSVRVEDVDETEEDVLQRWIIPPNYRHKTKWDIFFGLLIVYTVIIIPYRIGFGVEAEGFSWGFDVFIDVMFFCDMGAAFRTAYLNNEGVLNTVPRDIVRHYLRTWFVIDFISTVPFDHLIGAIFTQSGAQGGARAVKLIRIVRLARLLKLARILKMGKLMKNVEEVLAYSPMFFRFIKLGSQLIFLAHILGCFWFYVSSSVNSSMEACASGQLNCEPGEAAQTWWQGDNVALTEDQKGELYIAALYWAFTTMTTVGYGDITPANDNERIYAIISMIGGATIFGYIIGSIAGMAGQERGPDALTRKRVTVVRDFCEEQMVCRRIRDAAKKHYNFLYQERSPYAEAAILAEIPNALRRETVLFIHRDAIERVGLFLGGQQPDWFTAFAVRLLEPQVVMAGEDITLPTEPAQEIFFVYEGLCEGYTFQERGVLQPQENGPKDPIEEDVEFDFNKIKAVYGVGCLFGAEMFIPRKPPENYEGIAVRAADDGPASLYVLRQQTVMEISVFQAELGVCLQNAVAEAVYLQHCSRHTERNAERRRSELKELRGEADSTQVTSEVPLNSEGAVQPEPILSVLQQEGQVQPIVEEETSQSQVQPVVEEGESRTARGTPEANLVEI